MPDLGVLPLNRVSLPCLCLGAALLAAAPARAQNAPPPMNGSAPDDAQDAVQDDANLPPPWEDAAAPAGTPAGMAEPDGPTPDQSATATVNVVAGGSQVQVAVLNPHLGGAPLWLWVDGEGAPGAQVQLTGDGKAVLWQLPLGRVPKRGMLVVVPRPPMGANSEITVVLTPPGGTPASRPLSLMHPTIQQLALPVLVVGGPQAGRVADLLRERQPHRLVHTMPSASLPTQPAALLGMAAVVVAPDAVMPQAQGRALALLHCARRGVLMLTASTPLPLPEGCAPPPVMQSDGLPGAAALAGAVRDAQIELGLLEERGDTQVAAALLSGRPPAQAGALVLLLCLALLGGAVLLAQKGGAARGLLVMAGAPVLGAVLMLVVGRAWAREVSAVRLVMVDARAGAPVAVVRAVDAAPQPSTPLLSPTAWLATPPVPPGGARLVHISEWWDMVEVSPATVATDNQDGRMVRIRTAAGGSVQGIPCRLDEKVDTAHGAAAVHVKALKDRCRAMRGSLAPVDAALYPSLEAWLKPPAADQAVSAWAYVFEGRGGD